MASLLNSVMLLLFFVVYSLVFVCGDDAKDENQDRGAHSERGGVWFGPRLGKRSLELLDQKSKLQRLLEAADDLRFYYEQLPYELRDDGEQDEIAPKFSRSASDRVRGRTVHFTPRLGRRKLEQATPTATDDDGYKMPLLGNRRPMVFTPRLGRSFNFSPQLGNELPYDSYPSARVARSVNDSNTN